MHTATFRLLKQERDAALEALEEAQALLRRVKETRYGASMDRTPVFEAVEAYFEGE